jgi:hypothetical protein
LCWKNAPSGSPHNLETFIVKNAASRLHWSGGRARAMGGMRFFSVAVPTEGDTSRSKLMKSWLLSRE